MVILAVFIPGCSNVSPRLGLPLRCLPGGIGPILRRLDDPEPVAQRPPKWLLTERLSSSCQGCACAYRSRCAWHPCCILPTSGLPDNLLEHGLTRIVLLSVGSCLAGDDRAAAIRGSGSPQAASSLLRRSRLGTSSSAPLLAELCSSNPCS